MNTKTMSRYKHISIGLLSAGFLAACTPVVPPELANARRVYQQVSTGPAAQLAPADLHKAQESLDVANRAFDDDPKAQRTRDLAYVAERKAELADAIANGENAKRMRQGAENAYTKTQGEIIARDRAVLGAQKEQLTKAQQDALAQQQALGSERQARMSAEQRAADAEARAKDAQDALSKLAMVKQEDRGMVITLSGSVLFASNKSELLPEAQVKLDQVAQALMATKERHIIVEGYTDSRGSDTYNLDLSRRRAEAVRNYIVSKGYEGDLVTSQGLGKQSPIADNASAEGRANNRRVEIVVQPKKADTN